MTADSSVLTQDEIDNMLAAVEAEDEQEEQSEHMTEEDHERARTMLDQLFRMTGQTPPQYSDMAGIPDHAAMIDKLGSQLEETVNLLKKAVTQIAELKERVSNLEPSADVKPKLTLQKRML